MVKFLIIDLYCLILTFFSYLGFLSRTFTNHRNAGERGGHFINSSLPLPTASQTLRHQLGNYCRELISGHSQQPDPNGEPLVSERKLLTTNDFFIFRKLLKNSLLLNKKYFNKTINNSNNNKQHLITINGNVAVLFKPFNARS